MRSDDEDEEEEYEDQIEDENENDEDENRMDIDGEDGGDDDEERDRSGTAEGEALIDGEGDEDEEEIDAEGDGDGSDEQAGQDDDDEEEDADEDAEDSDGDGDEADGDEDDDEDGDEDETERIHVEGASSPVPSNISRTSAPRKIRSPTPTAPPLPAYKIRRNLLIPSYPPSAPPAHLTVDAIVAIPVPAPIHCLAATTCSSYLLTGSQEGVVRAYDFYASVNGQQTMTAQQRTIVGMGESIGKAGVGKGWWVSDIPDGSGSGVDGGESNGGNERRVEPVYSLAVEGDGLWALTGTQSGPINMYTLRHSPGQLVHSLQGHSSVVSCLALTTDEKRLLSGSWDGSIREWDLGTGQTSRTYPTHGAQISSLSLRPYSHPISPSPSPQQQSSSKDEADDAMEGKPHISVSVGPDFFVPRSTEVSPKGEKSSNIVYSDKSPKLEPNAATSPTIPSANTEIPVASGSATADARASRASSYDPLFDDEDADGETVPPSTAQTKPNSPIPQASTSAAGPSRLPLALPGSNQTNGSNSNGHAPHPSTQQYRSEGAAATIPLLSPTAFKQFSDDVMLASFMDGQVMLVDRRVPDGGDGGIRGVGRLSPGDKAPPWCMSACWSGNGNQILAGRRNGTIDLWDVRRTSSSTAPNILRTLKTPIESGPVSCVVAFPDGQHIATASQDNIRLWNTVEYFDAEDTSSFKKARSKPPFKIVAGHHGGTISAMLADPTCRFLTVASGDRGWAGESTKVVLIHEVKW